MTSLVECCPRCGDQTLWRHAHGEAWCDLCGHTWAYTPTVDKQQLVFACNDPEGEWIKDQEGDAA